MTRPQASGRQAGRGLPAVDLDLAVETGIDTRVNLIALDLALTRLEVSLADAGEGGRARRDFGGLSVIETATLLGVAPITVKRHWAFARIWLHRELAPR